jgi:hypothetical protein
VREGRLGSIRSALWFSFEDKREYDSNVEVDESQISHYYRQILLNLLLISIVPFLF